MQCNAVNIVEKLESNAVLMMHLFHKFDYFTVINEKTIFIDIDQFVQKM